MLFVRREEFVTHYLAIAMVNCGGRLSFPASNALIVITIFAWTQEVVTGRK
jgi:hypothetical protein